MIPISKPLVFKIPSGERVDSDRDPWCITKNGWTIIYGSLVSTNVYQITLVDINGNSVSIQAPPLSYMMSPKAYVIQGDFTPTVDMAVPPTPNASIPLNVYGCNLQNSPPYCIDAGIWINASTNQVTVYGIGLVITAADNVGNQANVLVLISKFDTPITINPNEGLNIVIEFVGG